MAELVFNASARANQTIQWPTQTSHAALVTKARSCWSEYTTWRQSFMDWQSSESHYTTFDPTAFLANTTTVVVSPTTKTIYPTGLSETYRLCDGRPRATHSPLTTSFNTTITSTMETQLWVSPFYTISPPCEPDPDDCAVYYFDTNMPYYKEGKVLDSLEAACGLPLNFFTPCLIEGGRIRLIYFPEARQTDLCDSGEYNTLQSPAPTETGDSLAKVTTLGHTFAPGSVYISFQTLYAAYHKSDRWGGSAIEIGPNFKNTIMTFDSTEISTNCWSTINEGESTTAGFGMGRQLTFADFNEPIPASAYKCQDQCSSYYWDQESKVLYTPNPCGTIWNNFHPLLAMPTRIRDMVPEWSTCSFWGSQEGNSLFDPPVALTTVSSIAGPTLPAHAHPMITSITIHAVTTAATPLQTATAEAVLVTQTSEMKNQSPGTTTTAYSPAETSHVGVASDDPIASQVNSLIDDESHALKSGATNIASDNPAGVDPTDSSHASDHESLAANLGDWIMLALGAESSTNVAGASATNDGQAQSANTSATDAGGSTTDGVVSNGTSSGRVSCSLLYVCRFSFVFWLVGVAL